MFGCVLWAEARVAALETVMLVCLTFRIENVCCKCSVSWLYCLLIEIQRLCLSLLWVILSFRSSVCVLDWIVHMYICLYGYLCVYALCSLGHVSCLCLVMGWSDVYKKAWPSGKLSMVNKVLFKQKHAKCKHKSALVSCGGHIWHQCIPSPYISPQLLSCSEKNNPNEWKINVING